MANLQSILLVVSLAGLLALVGYLLGGEPFALGAALAVGLLYLLNPRVAPWLMLKSFRARPLDVVDAPRLYQAVETLTARAGLAHRPRLFLLPHAAPLAFTTGDGAGAKAAIALSQGLLQTLSLREVTGVLAHEISHIRHQDTRIMGFAHTLSQMTGLVAGMGQLLLIISLPMLLMAEGGVSVTALILLISAPQLSVILQLALSRAREYNADMGAAELLGSPDPLAEALYRLERHNRSIRHRLPWFLTPRREPLTWLSTHPPTEKRIRRLMDTAPSKPWKGLLGGPWQRTLLHWRSGF
jgi:heat shock protein HtpX